MLTQEGKDYKDTVAGLCVAAGILKPLVGNVELDIYEYRPQERGDIDGPLKLILDSIQGYVYTNDAQVRRMTVIQYTDRENPRVELKAWAISL